MNDRGSGVVEDRGFRGIWSGSGVCITQGQGLSKTEDLGV